MERRPRDVGEEQRHTSLLQVWVGLHQLPRLSCGSITSCWSNRPLGAVAVLFLHLSRHMEVSLAIGLFVHCMTPHTIQRE